jgi:mRNA-degrading endonuclease RelE of RelBE toxin-antitoxin system
MRKRWVVLADRGVAKQLGKLPKPIVEILDQLRHDLEEEGPTPKGWIVKHVLGRRGLYSVRLKREYRAFYEVADLSITLISVAHRKEAY